MKERMEVWTDELNERKKNQAALPRNERRWKRKRKRG